MSLSLESGTSGERMMRTDKQVENPVDETADQLRSIGQTGTAADRVTKELQKRKLISPK